jgi:signal transduction histidine kinase
VTPLSDSLDRSVGRVFLFREVTDQVRRQRELRERTAQLERQNERLDQFASIVSHDLRNPLNVAQGRLELAREDPSAEHFDQIDGAIDRMEALIEDVLALAQQTDDVETERVDLGRVATEAWTNVDSPDARLECDLAAQVTGDRSRLLQAFENLFRNAIDHGPKDVTVRVGKLATESAGDGIDRPPEQFPGFFVADDGPGIPADQRETVFERGYTTDAGGTGLGLAIVQAAVEAHGWAVRVTESSTGGARFEVRPTVAQASQSERPEGEEEAEQSGSLGAGTSDSS